MEYIEASFTGLLRVIVIFLIIYIAIRFIRRVILPMLMKQQVNKAQEQYYERMKQQQRKHKKRDDGEYIYKDGVKIKIDKNKGKDKDGEYTDYEIVE